MVCPLPTFDELAGGRVVVSGGLGRVNDLAHPVDGRWNSGCLPTAMALNAAVPGRVLDGGAGGARGCRRLRRQCSRCWTGWWSRSSIRLPGQNLSNCPIAWELPTTSPTRAVPPLKLLSDLTRGPGVALADRRDGRNPPPADVCRLSIVLPVAGGVHVRLLDRGGSRRWCFDAVVEPAGGFAWR